MPAFLHRAPLRGGVLGSRHESFAVAEWTDPGGRVGEPQLIAPPHVHRNDDEAWYVLEGRLGFRVDGEVLVAGPGDGVLVCRGSVHTFWNPGPEAARYLLVMPPRIASLIEALHDRDDRTLEVLFAEHDSSLAAG